MGVEFDCVQPSRAGAQKTHELRLCDFPLRASSHHTKHPPLLTARPRVTKKPMTTLVAETGAAVEAVEDGFEGAEKVLEIDFVERELQDRGTSEDVPAHDHRAKGADAGMRAVSRREWDAILELAQCQILTHESNNFLDSYVLSESSLFVYSHKIVLKTCGTTTLLRCIPALLAAAAKFGLVVEWISFTRKDFLFPKRQAFPHTSFDEEVKFLLAHFPEGSAYVLGPITGAFVVKRFVRGAR